MEQFIPLIFPGVPALIVLAVIWYVITRFLVNIGEMQKQTGNGLIVAPTNGDKS